MQIASRSHLPEGVCTDQTLSMEDTIVGVVCGNPECLNLTEAKHVPDRCFVCGARTETHAVVRVDVDIDGLGIDITPTIDFVGDWDVDLAAQVREAVE